MATATLTLDALNQAPQQAFVEMLQGIYEHSPWIAQRAAAARPFASPEALKWALCQVVRDASRDEQLGLIRAHPELAGDRKSTRLNSSHVSESRMPSSA